MNFRNPTVPAYPRKNILTPLLWLNAITFPGAAAAFMYSWQPGAVLLTIATIVLCFTLYYYAKWSERDPDRLQTEDFRLQQAALTRLPQNLGYSEQQIPPANAPRLIGSSTGSEVGE